MKECKRLVLIGGGGHCMSVLDSARRMGIFQEIVITDNGKPIGSDIMGCKVAGDDGMLEKLYQSGFRYAFLTIGSIGGSHARQAAYGAAAKVGFCFPNIIDPSAAVSSHAKLGSGIFIGKNAAVNAGACIGDMVIINSGAVVEHGCQIGEFSHISVGAAICGDVVIGKSVFAGANAAVIQGVEIGSGSVIGAGSVVLSNVLAGSTRTGIVKDM